MRLTATETDILAPLRFFYGLASGDLRVTFVEAGALPAIDKNLLVHEYDMTSRLAQHHGCGIVLDVHAASRMGEYLVRASVLRRSDNNVPVEFGAIGIHLTDFHGEARRLIIDAHLPLGGILQQLEVPFTSHPRGYFQIVIDHRLENLLGGVSGQTLFGRCNQLRHASGRPFAEVVEILPAAL